MGDQVNDIVAAFTFMVKELRTGRFIRSSSSAPGAVKSEPYHRIKENVMNKKMIFMALVALSMMYGLSAIHSTDAFAGCREDCYKSCCGDEGICGEEEQPCVSNCMKDCGSEDDSGSMSSAPPDRGGSSVQSDDDEGEAEGDPDRIEKLPDKKTSPMEKTNEPHNKKPISKQPGKATQQTHES
jgi:hypothetical protein